MQVVGYNDNFVTQDGTKGGFILKNNWNTVDNINPSHSIGYFVQELSRWDENIMCPNSANPRNWYTCESLHVCLSEKTKLYADISRQSLEMRCIDPNLCRVSPDIDYYVQNYTHVGDGMHLICLIEYDYGNKVGQSICLKPLVLDDIISIIYPRTILPNDPDHCGFYFFPYTLIDTWWSRFHDSFVTDFEIDWHESSYLANKDKYPEYDYSHLEKSTKRQTRYHFLGPIPYEHLPWNTYTGLQKLAREGINNDEANKPN
eukprot:g42419.t1